MLIFVLLAMSKPLHAQYRLPPEESHFQLRGEFDYLTTSANYTSAGGSSIGLVGGGKLTNVSGLGEFTYDLNKQFRMWGGVSGGQTQAYVIDQTFTTSTDIITDYHTNTGLSQGWIGAQGWWHFNQVDLVPEGDFVYPFFRVDQTSTSPLLGEGSMNLQAGSWIMVHLNQLTPFVYGGYTYRDGGRSALFPYSAGLRFEQSATWWVQMQLQGYQSLGNDSNSNARNIRDGFLNLTDGGSYQYFAINPSHGEVAGQIGVRFGAVSIYAGGSFSVYGSSSADDWSGHAGIMIDGGPTAKVQSSPLPAEPAEGFHEKLEKYDDRVFQENSSVVPAKPAVEEEERLPAPVKKSVTHKKPVARKKPKPKPDDTMPNVEQLMKDTEKTLDKKKN